MTQDKQNEILGWSIFGGIALIVVFSWYAPWLSLLVSILLLFVAAKLSSKSIRSGVGAIGLLTLVLSFSFVCMRISSCNARGQEEKEIQVANEQVADGVKIAQASFDKGELDQAERKLNEILTNTKATDTQAAIALQGRITATREAAVAGEAAAKVAKANREVADQVKWAEFTFNSGNLKAAEERLAKALIVQDATETEKARELLDKVQVARRAALFRAVQQSIDRRNFQDAIQSLSSYLADPLGGYKEHACQLLQLLQVVNGDGNAKSFLASMTADQFASFSTTGHLPEDLAVKEIKSLNELAETTLAKYVDIERRRRAQERSSGFGQALQKTVASPDYVGQWRNDSYSGTGENLIRIFQQEGCFRIELVVGSFRSSREAVGVLEEGEQRFVSKETLNDFIRRLDDAEYFIIDERGYLVVCGIYEGPAVRYTPTKLEGESSSRRVKQLNDNDFLPFRDLAKAVVTPEVELTAQQVKGVSYFCTEAERLRTELEQARMTANPNSDDLERLAGWRTFSRRFLNDLESLEEGTTNLALPPSGLLVAQVEIWAALETMFQDVVDDRLSSYHQLERGLPRRIRAIHEELARYGTERQAASRIAAPP